MAKKSTQKSKESKKRVYLDYAAATPVDIRVQTSMKQFWSESFGNAGSIHKEGMAAKHALEHSRKEIATNISSRDDKVIFTSGGTESNNLAIFGTISACKKKGTALQNMHAVASVIEHPSILNCFKELEEMGVKVTYLPVDAQGFISPETVYRSLRKETVIVSIMYANSEIGTIEPIAEIARIVQKFRIEKKQAFPYIHTDASQTPLYLPCSTQKLGIDMMSLDAQKIYGPKGVGCLYIKNGIIIDPLFKGGGQENRMRAGTENIPLIVGFSRALSLAVSNRETEVKHIKELRDYFIQKLLDNIKGIELNGDIEKRIANNVNVSIPGFDSEFLVVALDDKGIAASSKSACIGSDAEKSYVVSALGKNDALASSSLRFSLGSTTVKKDIDSTIKALQNILEIQGDARI